MFVSSKSSDSFVASWPYYVSPIFAPDTDCSILFSCVLCLMFVIFFWTLYALNSPTLFMYILNVSYPLSSLVIILSRFLFCCNSSSVVLDGSFTKVYPCLFPSISSQYYLSSLLTHCVIWHK